VIKYTTVAIVNISKGKTFMKHIENELTEKFFSAILNLESKEECYRFFEDICTVTEIIEMSKRLTAAKMLSDNCTYTDIIDKTGLSTATISRVNRCLKYGSDGYVEVLHRLDAKGESPWNEDDK
jgi:TrpR-related protein YerC/YecD